MFLINTLTCLPIVFSSESTKAANLKRRKDFPEESRACCKWLKAEQDLLLNLYLKENKDIKEISKIHLRSEKAITCELKRLGCKIIYK